MKKTIAMIGLVCLCLYSSAQELYVATEPASNMATGSIGLRMNTKLFYMSHAGRYSYRIDPEVMIGVNKHLMVHANLYGSDMYQNRFRAEGGGVYAKYRFLSQDDVHSHFRMAAFGRVSLIKNPSVLQEDHTYFIDHGNGVILEHHETVTYENDEIDIEGNNSGFVTGVVATQLVHKLAVSSSVAWAQRWKNIDAVKYPGQSEQAISYTLSAGYLLLPREYKDYKQTNMNLYCELLGSSSVDKKGYFLDVAPAVQFIFNSISRLDLSYRKEIAGTMKRLSDSYFMVRFEYNLLNVFKNR
jgi:hypothetical protein